MAIHKPTGRQLAVKKLLKESLTAPKMRATLQREIKIHKLLKHINIVRFFANLEDRKYIYLVMEYAARGELFLTGEPNLPVDGAPHQLHHSVAGRRLGV